MCHHKFGHRKFADSMLHSSDKPQRQIELLAAAIEQQSILAELLNLYAQDFRAFHVLPLDEAGQFQYPNLALYWQDPSRHPFLIHVDRELAGFVFIYETDDTPDGRQVWDIAEFFVLQQFRRQNIGTHIAYEVWTKFPGLWQVRVMLLNVPGHRFWENAIASYAGSSLSSDRFDKDAEQWVIFRFNSQPNPAPLLCPAAATPVETDSPA